RPHPFCISSVPPSTARSRATTCRAEAECGQLAPRVEAAKTNSRSELTTLKKTQRAERVDHIQGSRVGQRSRSSTSDRVFDKERPAWTSPSPGRLPPTTPPDRRTG